MAPEFSLVIPVWRESGRINRTIAHLHRLAGIQRAEIIVVDGDPRGRTLAALAHGGVRTAVAAKGRGAQMNRGARMARGPVVIFVHADTRLPPRALVRVRRLMGAGGVEAGAFRLGIDSPRPVYRWIEAAVDLRTRLTRVPYGDQAIFMSKSLFWRLGGFSQIPIMEDVELMGRLKRAGHRVGIVADRVRTSPRRWESEGVLRCTLRNWTLIALYTLGADPARLVAHYP